MLCSIPTCNFDNDFSHKTLKDIANGEKQSIPAVENGTQGMGMNHYEGQSMCNP